MKKKKLIGKVLGFFVLIASILHVYPIFLVVLSSLKSRADLAKNPFGLPKEWAFENYMQAFDKMNYFQSFANSVIVVLITMVPLIIFSSMAAYAIVRKGGKYNWLYMVFVFGLIVPYQMIMIPLYQTVKNIGLLDSHVGLAVVYLALFAPFSVFLFTGFIKSVPLELEEAAYIDGCGTYRTFFLIVFPLLKPGIATIAVLNIFNIWNDFLQPMMFLSTRSKNTLVVQIYQFVGQYTNNWPLIFSSICIIVVPIFVVYVFAQKYIIGGITAGAVKG